MHSSYQHVLKVSIPMFWQHTYASLCPTSVTICGLSQWHCMQTIFKLTAFVSSLCIKLTATECSLSSSLQQNDAVSRQAYSNQIRSRPRLCVLKPYACLCVRVCIFFTWEDRVTALGLYGKPPWKTSQESCYTSAAFMPIYTICICIYIYIYIYQTTRDCRKVRIFWDEKEGVWYEGTITMYDSNPEAVDSHGNKVSATTCIHDCCVPVDCMNIAHATYVQTGIGALWYQSLHASAARRSTWIIGSHTCIVCVVTQSTP
jgi:hypothetical protein